MDARLIQRVMDLAERTGDKVIIVNPKSGQAHAILPFDAYEDLIVSGASLQELEDLEDQAGDNDDGELAFDDFIAEPARKVESEKTPPATLEELEKMATHDLNILKSADLSEKDVEETNPIDIMDSEANEEQYYLEPLE